MLDAAFTLTITLHLWWLWAYLGVGLVVVPWLAVKSWKGGSESRRLSFWRYAGGYMIPDKRWRIRRGWFYLWLLWPVGLWEELR